MVWPDVLRVFTVILALGYMPLLYLRIMRTETKVNVIHLFGTFSFIVGIIVGSWQAYHAPFHYGQIFFSSGIVITLISGTIAESKERSKK